MVAKDCDKGQGTKYQVSQRELMRQDNFGTKRWMQKVKAAKVKFGKLSFH